MKMLIVKQSQMEARKEQIAGKAEHHENSLDTILLYTREAYPWFNVDVEMS